jgi:hypothetical protein
MQRKSQGSAEPLSTHSSIQILAKENSLPDIRAYWSVGSDAGELSGVLFLTVETEHRTADFDHTATFTISGRWRPASGGKRADAAPDHGSYTAAMTPWATSWVALIATSRRSRRWGNRVRPR